MTCGRLSVYDRPQHRSQAGWGQEHPPGGHGPAAPHNASAGDDAVTAIEGHPRGFAPPACRRSEEMAPMARYRGPLARARYAGQQSADRAVWGTHAGRHWATGEDSPPAFPNGNKTGHGDPRGASVRATPPNGLSRALASAPQRRRPHARPAFMGRASTAARHARRTPRKAADDARHGGIRGQLSARCRTPCEADRRQPCRLRCPNHAGVRTVWILPSGDHSAAGQPGTYAHGGGRGEGAAVRTCIRMSPKAGSAAQGAALRGAAAPTRSSGRRDSRGTPGNSRPRCSGRAMS